MTTRPKIVIIGMGRLGRSVAQALEEAGWVVIGCGRGDRPPKAPITWLTVPDTSLAEVVTTVPTGGVILHASGAMDLSVLRPRSPIGSLHPLMTFPGPEVSMPEMSGLPAAMSGDPLALQAAKEIIGALGWSGFVITGDRALYHSAAVMAGNYATTLLCVAADILAAAGVQRSTAPDLLIPLAMQSIRNAASDNVETVLTGPIVRRDEAIITAHQAALSQLDPENLELYNTMLSVTRTLLKKKKN